MAVKKGQLITLSYEGRYFDVIVIDPNGLGQDQPSVGFGFRMAERYVGIPNNTLSDWQVEPENGVLDKTLDRYLKLPSGKAFRVLDIQGSDGNLYNVVEASDWVAIAVNVLVEPGRTAKGLRPKLGEFLQWFATKGFYAEAYVVLKGVYTDKDSRATTAWLESRYIGIPVRKIYTDLLQAQGCRSFDYGNWTNHIYQGLFGKTKNEMIKDWDLMDGRKDIARNYIPEVIGLDAVRFCEDMTVRVFVDDLKEAHDFAIDLTKRKYLSDWDN